MLGNWWKKVFLSLSSWCEQGWPWHKGHCQMSPFFVIQSAPCLASSCGGGLFAGIFLRSMECPYQTPDLGKCLPGQHKAPAKAPGSSARFYPEPSCSHSPEPSWSVLEAHRFQGLQLCGKQSKAPLLQATSLHLSSPCLNSVFPPMMTPSGKLFSSLLLGGKSKDF